MVGLIIFDCDGVLVDSEPISIAILKHTLDRWGLKLSEAELYQRFLGRSFAAMIDILARDFDLILPEDALTSMRVQLYERFRTDLRPVPGVEQAIDRLDVPVCVASSSQPERIALSLTVTGLAERFGPHVFSASQVEKGKPAPDLFLHAARSMGMEPDQCVVIEDSPAGVRAAKAAGMKVFGFTGGGHAGPAGLEIKLEELSPDALFCDMHRLTDLLDLIENHERFG